MSDRAGGRLARLLPAEFYFLRYHVRNNREFSEWFRNGEKFEKEEEMKHEIIGNPNLWKPVYSVKTEGEAYSVKTEGEAYTVLDQTEVMAVPGGVVIRNIVSFSGLKTLDHALSLTFVPTLYLSKMQITKHTK